jgi:hypothetical protein
MLESNFGALNTAQDDAARIVVLKQIAREYFVLTPTEESDE